MFKNVASQKIQLFAFDATTNVPKTGDAANITAYVSKDHGAVTVLGDTSATEMDATNAAGNYVFDLTQAETNADELTFSAKSSTANIKIVPRFISTNPPNYTAASIDSNGRVDIIKVAGTTQTAGDIIGDTNDIQSRLPASLSPNLQMACEVLYWNGGAVPLPSITGVPKVDPTHWLGTAISAPPVAGIPTVNVKTWNNLTTVALPLVPTVAGRTLDCSAGGEAGVDWANVGSPTTSLALTGTTIAVTQKVDVDTIKTNPVVNAGTVTFPTAATLASTTNLTAGTIAAVSGAVGSVTGAVGSVTGLTASNLDTTVSSRLSTAGYTVPPTAASVATAVFTTQLTESYAAVHVVPTLAQAIFEIRSRVTEESVSGTTLTTLKVDGSTPAATFTLNSATTPTSITRTS